MEKFRALRADEVEVRASNQAGSGWCFLLYKDARCDMNILDECVGAMNWQRHHSRDNANCIVSIWDEDKKQWVDKEDTGTESYTEKEKGMASDSFKRACFNWGIGRELYTAPFIWVSTSKLEMNKKNQPTNKLYVSAMTVEEGKITALIIKDKKNNAVMFTYGTSKQQGEPERPKKNSNSADIKTTHNGVKQFAESSEHTVEEITKLLLQTIKADCKTIEELDDMQLRKAIKQLSVWQSKYDELSKENS